METAIRYRITIRKGLQIVSGSSPDPISDIMKALLGMKFVDDTKKLDEIIYKLIPTPLSLILSSILSLLSMLFMTSKHNRSQPSKANTPRLRVNHYHTVRHDSRFLGTHTTRRTIHRDSGGSSGGGGFTGGTHSGGGFSGGGGSFSGGGGHF